MRRISVSVSLGLLIALIGACGTAQTRVLTVRPVALGEIITTGALPLGPLDRDQLTALPKDATYRWGEPHTHFGSHPQPADDDPPSPRAVEDLRADATLILRLHGWRAVSSGEEAQFELAIARYERTVQWLERVGDAPPQRPDPRQCAHLGRSQRVRCENPEPQPVSRPRRDVQNHFAFAIVRVRDRATAWWITPHQKDLSLFTLDLLRAGAGIGTAFWR